LAWFSRWIQLFASLFSFLGLNSATEVTEQKTKVLFKSQDRGLWQFAHFKDSSFLRSPTGQRAIPVSFPTALSWQWPPRPCAGHGTEWHTSWMDKQLSGIGR
jgi:hypothetical protein